MKAAVAHGEYRRPAAPSSDEVMAFYFMPTRYMDPSWWVCGVLPENLRRRLAGDSRSHRHLSRYFLKQAGLDPAPHLDLPPATRRLALMEKQRLERLLVLAGLTLLSPSIAGVLRREERNRIKNGIGTQEYEFALRRGRFLLQQSGLSNVQAAVPLAGFDAVEHQCRRVGLRALASALCDAPTGLTRRMQLKFRKAIVESHWRPLADKPSEFLRLFTLLDRQAGFP